MSCSLRDATLNFASNIKGIYMIHCMDNGRFYVGQSLDIRRRFGTHKRKLEGGVHENILLQNSYNRYGENGFYVDVLEIVDDTDMADREIYWADELESFDVKKGFNLCPIVSREDINPDFFALKMRGSKNGMSKLTEEDVVVICEMCNIGVDASVIATEFNVSVDTIWSIRKGRTWTSLSKDLLDKAIISRWRDDRKMKAGLVLQ